jgi:hypothetical protein
VGAELADKWEFDEEPEFTIHPEVKWHASKFPTARDSARIDGRHVVHLRRSSTTADAASPQLLRGRRTPRAVTRLTGVTRRPATSRSVEEAVLPGGRIHLGS